MEGNSLVLIIIVVVVIVRVGVILIIAIVLVGLCGMRVPKFICFIYRCVWNF